MKLTIAFLLAWVTLSVSSAPSYPHPTCPPCPPIIFSTIPISETTTTPAIIIPPLEPAPTSVAPPVKARYAFAEVPDCICAL
ncbi:hypothetical protein EW145_g1032 [Phellinidium pouzarii]|uniref:Uncharacterized protein n=1 Tax=Phellinidium pouzarii TaxID=167371 RepID=A0A4S4LG99_9AGAM|nr:hypothetical protein EW145_g1032 [Phellinidium pouzarii]